MDKSKIDWSKAPEWAGAVVASGCGVRFYVTQFGGISKRQQLEKSSPDVGNEADMEDPHNWTLVEERPAKPAIATLEERIRARAISDFGFKVEETMHAVRNHAFVVMNKPSGIADLDIRAAIDLVYGAIIREAGPIKADQALDRALAELARTLTK